ncbi:MAG: DUF302 domain-containing protein [Ktedonobacterales bacterium]
MSDRRSYSDEGEEHMLPTPDGITTKPSGYAVDETIARLEAAIKAHSLTLFARINHQQAAAEVGLSMQPAQVLIFGSPRAGTPLMVAAPLSALDLPLKALVWQDGDDTVWVSYTDPAYLAQRYALPDELARNIAGITQLIAGALS